MNEQTSCTALVIALLGLCVAGSLAAAEPQAVPGGQVQFTKHQLDHVFRSEGVAAGDFNRDGRLDIAAGPVWYEAPDWKMHSLVEQPPEYDPRHYSNSFCNFTEDLNGDGWLDLIVVDFPGTPTWWFENPQQPGQLWKRHMCVPVTNNESPQYVDLTGDGKRELVLGVAPDSQQADGPQRRMAYATPAEDPYEAWQIHAISEAGAPGTRRYSHGLGIGDVNGDGRSDILCPEGWWQAPEDYRTAELWPFESAQMGQLAAHMPVYDFDGDGDADVLTSSPHAFGIWWHQQQEDGSWKTHSIDDSFSQTHAVCLADINSDGLADFVTGKRWWAHAEKDPGSEQPAVMHWFELQRKEGTAQWVRHQFDHDSGIGTQFEVVDMNDDGLLDVVTANKKGVFYFQQSRGG